MAALAKEETRGIRLMYLVKDVPEEVAKLIPLSKLKSTQKNAHPLLMETLESMKETEKAFFGMDTTYSCILAYLYVDKLKCEYHGDKRKELKDKAKTELGSLLEKEPDNLLGLCIKRQMEEIVMLKQKNTKSKIKTLVQCELSVSHAYAIIALYLNKLHMVGASIELFEQAISTWESQDRGDEFKVVFWKFLSATAYRQQLISDVYIKQQDFDPDKTMTRIKDLLRSGISLGESHKTLAARCYSKLGMTYSRYKLIGKHENRTVALELAPSVLACYEKAWELCDGQDPQVIEKYAKFVAHTRHDEESKLFAADLFKQLLEMHPTRHVAAHQLGLLYRSLCFRDKIEQPHLQPWHKNVEQKNFDSYRQMKPQYNVSSDLVRGTKYTEGATGALKDQPESSEASILQDQPEGESPGQESNGASVQDQLDRESLEQKSSETNILRHQPRRESEEQKSNGAHILQDQAGWESEEQIDKYDKENQIQNTSDGKVEMNQREYQHVPMHKYDSPKPYESQQADNPKAKSNYLELAIQYFQQAVDITKGSRARYLIDLARVKISNEEEEDALLLFQNAKCVHAQLHDKPSETAYLYEQWALLLSKQYLESSSESDCATMSDTSCSETCGNDERLNKIERYFLKSFRSSIASKSRSKVAYYKLADALQKDRSGKKWPVLCEIYQQAGQHYKAKQLLKDKDKTQPQARKLLKQQCIEDKEYDKYLNLSYTIYYKKPSNNLTQDIVEMTLRRAKFVLSALENEERKTDEENGEAMAIDTDYGDALKLCFQQQKPSEASTMHDQPKQERQEQKSNDAITVQGQSKRQSQEQKSNEAITLQDQPKQERQEQKSNNASTVYDQPKMECHASPKLDQAEEESQKQECHEARSLQDQPKRERQQASASDVQSGRETKEQKSEGASANGIQLGLENAEQQNLDEGIPKDSTQRTLGQQRQQPQRLIDVQVFMACRQKNDVFKVVYDFLTLCGITAKRYCMEGSDDFDFGSNEEHEISETLKFSQLMLLFDYKLENIKLEKGDPLTRFDWIVGYAQKQVELPVYIIHNNQDTDVQLPDRFPWATFPRIHVSGQNVDFKITLHNFMVDLFGAIRKHDFSDFKLIPKES